MRKLFIFLITVVVTLNMLTIGVKCRKKRNVEINTDSLKHVHDSIVIAMHADYVKTITFYKHEISKRDNVIRVLSKPNF
jgi:hypothetical protein